MVCLPARPDSRTPPRTGTWPVVRDPDPPREEQQERRRLEEAAGAELEDPRVLEEELALLGIEEVEAGEVHLLVVGLDLGEVGLRGHVEDDAGLDLPLGIEPEVPLRLGGSAARPASRSCVIPERP